MLQLTLPTHFVGTAPEHAPFGNVTAQCGVQDCQNHKVQICHGVERGLNNFYNNLFILKK